MKMNRVCKSFALAGALSLAATGVTVEAAEVKSYESNATIQFNAPTDAPPVYDPEDPSKEYDPANPDGPNDPVTGHTGPLTLDYVSSINFGEHDISIQEMVYQSTTLRPFIQVTDRRGTAAGWHVTASLSNFTNAEDTEIATLKGAELSFYNGEVLSPNGTAEPTPYEFKLTPGGASAAVVNAEEGSGIGPWINRWFPTVSEPETNDSITLSVPLGASTEGTHSAVITWTLMNTPQ